VIIPAVVVLLGRWNWWPPPLFRQRLGATDTENGKRSNERLTALAGAVLLVLAVVEVVTVPTLRSLLPRGRPVCVWHVWRAARSVVAWAIIHVGVHT
jgi:hypothetical protein